MIIISSSFLKLRKAVLWLLPFALLVYLYFVNMKTSILASVAVLASSALAQNATSTSSAPLTEYTLQADNITAVVLPYGARLVSLLVPDRNGVQQDVAVGYDDASQYPSDSATNHTFFGNKNTICLTRSVLTDVQERLWAGTRTE